MARLNESIAAPPESIEILKRRFIRQNREIARINSIQSLRIRSLEAEVSSLLSENVSLREQVISLSREIDRLEAAKAFQLGVHDIKTRLDAKLAELSSLVTDLGALPRKFQKSYDERSKPANPPEPLRRSSDLRHRKTNAESQLSDYDGRLPVILEDKYYPRETLEPEELQNLINKQDALSTDLEETHTITNPEYIDETDESQVAHTDDGNSDCLPPTLEMRRKRRVYSPTPGETGPRNRTGGSTTHFDLATVPKSGSKRKFDPEECDQYAAASAESDGDFEFSRPAQAPPKVSEDAPEHADNMLNPRQIDGRGRPRSREPPKRKVLEPKSTNASISSRNRVNEMSLQGYKVQQRWDGEGENSKPCIELESKATRRQRDVSAKSDSRQPHERRKGKDDVQQHAAQENSTPRDSRALQPQETSAAHDNGNTSSRATRRQRSVVSYAEPNLKDKMRRSTNEFTDAVGNSGGRRSSSQTACANAKGAVERPSGNGSRDSDPADTDLDVLLNEPIPKPLGGTKSMASQRKRRTLPAKGDDPFTDIGHEDEANDSRSTRGYGYRQADRHSNTAEDSDASEMDVSGYGLGDNSFHDESATYQLSKPPPFPPADPGRVKRELRISARRRSMMV